MTNHEMFGRLCQAIIRAASKDNCELYVQRPRFNPKLDCGTCTIEMTKEDGTVQNVLLYAQFNVSTITITIDVDLLTTEKFPLTKIDLDNLADRIYSYSLTFI